MQYANTRLLEWMKYTRSFIFFKIIAIILFVFNVYQRILYVGNIMLETP